jgi:hypothetical protein
VRWRVGIISDSEVSEQPHFAISATEAFPNISIRGNEKAPDVTARGPILAKKDLSA